MALPFGLSVPQAVIAGGIAVTVGATKIIGPKAMDWIYDYRKARRERVRQWHRDVHGMLMEIRSVGMRVQASRRPDIQAIEELQPITVDLRKQVDSFPPAVRRMVDGEVLGTTRAAAGLAYHLTHIPRPPEEDMIPVSELMRHQYEILDRLGSDTDVELEDALEILGGIEDLDDDELEVSKGEAEEILSEFEREAGTRVEDMGEMTVDELMELPWEMVDDIVSEEARLDMVRHAVEQYYTIALVDKPRQAKNLLEESEDELFG